MDGLVKLVTEIPDQKVRKDEDFSDRLSSSYTVIMLLVFAGVVGMNQYVGDPIACWMPQHFTGSHSKYTDAYCWVRNTYYLPMEDEIPADNYEEQSQKKTLPYYQWVSFILIGQAILFYFPNSVWHSFNIKGGVDADTILESANSINKADKTDDRGDTLMIIRNQIHRFLSTRKQVVPLGGSKQGVKNAMGPGISSRRFGCYLVVLYIFTKCLYLANVIAQLFLLNRILAVEYSVYGIEVLGWMMKSYDWTLSPQVAFPRVTMCDFTVRRLGNLHRYTVQCTLPINLYNEKIYMFLWFWMVFVAICTAVSLVTWILRFVTPRDRLTYIQNHLRMLQRFSNESLEDDRRKVERFTKNYLRHDGVFLLRLIGHNTNTLTVSEIIGSLWDNWQDKTDKQDPNGPIPLMPTTEAEPLVPKEKLPE